MHDDVLDLADRLCTIMEDNTPLAVSTASDIMVLKAKLSALALAADDVTSLIARRESSACDLSGRKVAYAAPFSATVGFVHSLDTTFGGLAFAANLNHSARHTLQPDGSIIAPTADLRV